MDPGPSSQTKAQGKRAKRVFHSDDALNRQANSIQNATSGSKSYEQSMPRSLQHAKPPKRLAQIKDKKLRAQVARQHMSQRRAIENARLADEYLHVAAPGQGAGMIETEAQLERTHRVTQQQIRQSVAIEAASKSFELRLDGGPTGVGLGPYRSSYTRNGRHLLIGGRKGHLAAFDWQTGKLSCEIQVRETVRDVAWLHSNAFFAAAQKKYTYIYDGQGIEIHKLKNHTDVSRLEFLPYHFLLTTIGSAGYLKYQDTSTGQLVAQHRTGLGACNTMAQNPLTAVIHLGHANGTVTLWTPNLSTPAVKLLAHRGPLTGISVDTRNGAHELATSGLDGSIKVWDSRMLGRGPRREWLSRKPASDIAYSQRGLLGLAWGTHVSVYNTNSALGNAPPGPYLTNAFPRSDPLQLSWCPFEDVLGVGHAAGFTSLLVPGAGEPNFDSREADPFESKGARREREVHALLDKIRPELITLDPDLVGSLQPRENNTPIALTEAARARNSRLPDNRSYAQLSRMERLAVDGKADAPDGVSAHHAHADADADADQDMQPDGVVDVAPNGRPRPAKVALGKPKDKKKMRGRNTAMKRYLAKKKQNVIDPNTLALKAKLERMEREANTDKRDSSALPESALDLFKRRREAIVQYCTVQ